MVENNSSNHRLVSQLDSAYGYQFLRWVGGTVMKELNDDSKKDRDQMWFDIEIDALSCSSKSLTAGVLLNLLQDDQSLEVCFDEFGAGRAIGVELDLIHSPSGKLDPVEYMTTSAIQTVGRDLAMKYLRRPTGRIGEKVSKVSFVNEQGEVIGRNPRGDVLGLRDMALAAYDYHRGARPDRTHFFQMSPLVKEDLRLEFFHEREFLLNLFDDYLKRRVGQVHQNLSGVVDRAVFRLNKDPDFIDSLYTSLKDMGLSDDRDPSQIYRSLVTDSSFSTKHRQDMALGEAMVVAKDQMKPESPDMQIVTSERFILLIGYILESNRETGIKESTAVQQLFDAIKTYYEWWNRSTLFGIYDKDSLDEEGRLRLEYANNHARVWEVARIEDVVEIRRKRLIERNLWQVLRDEASINRRLRREMSEANLKRAIGTRRDLLLDHVAKAPDRLD